MKTPYIILLFCVITNFIYQVVFKDLSILFVDFELTFENVIDLLFTLILHPNFWIAFFMFALSAVFWIIGIKNIALSKAFSFLSLNYLLIIGYSYIFLNEGLSFKKIGACILIVFGVILLAQSEKIKTLWKKGYT